MASAEMTKQEEIREGMEKFISKAYWYEGQKNIVVSITDEAINYLSSQGCVIKVEGELPDMPKEINCLVEGWRPLSISEVSGIKAGFKVILKAGYVKTEPLIEASD